MGMVRCAECKRPYFQKDGSGCPNLGCPARQAPSATAEPVTPKLDLAKPVAVVTPSVVSTSPKAETWRERDARLAKEREAAAARDQRSRVELGIAVQKKYETMVVVRRDGLFFRCCGRGQEPWDLVRTEGFVHRNGKKSASQLKEYLAEIYGTRYGGANNYMTLYRASAANNPAGAPFISAGVKPGDPSGASNTFWQYAIEIEGLEEVPVTAELLGVPALSPKVGDVRLLMNDKNFDLATTRVLLHGPLPEATWLSHIELSSIKAWTRIGGDLWQQDWREFNAGIIEGVRELAKDFGRDIAQGG